MAMTDRKVYLSQNLKALRKFNNITMEFIYKETGLSQGFISRIEHGHFDNLHLSVNTILKLAILFNITIEELLFSKYELNISQNQPYGTTNPQ